MRRTLHIPYSLARVSQVEEKEWALYQEVGGLMTGAAAVKIREAKVVDGRIFPMALRPRTYAVSNADRLAFVAAERSKIFQLVESHGAVLLRGAPTAPGIPFLT